ARRGLGGEQVEGRHAVFELLLAGARRTREVLFAGDLDPAPILDDIIALANELKVPIREMSRGKFEAMARTAAPQGVMAISALRRLRGLGVWSVGLEADAAQSLFDLPIAEQPVVLVLGAEGAGLSSLVRQRCHALVAIPLRGRLNSLNVSVAGALACYEVTR